MRDLSQSNSSPELRDFRYIGIIWVVQVQRGWRSEFYRLSDLKRYLAEGRVQPTDLLSYDRETWTPINQIKDLSAHFEEIWHLASQGKLRVRHQIGRGSDFEDETPTRVVSNAPFRSASAPLQLSPPELEPFEMPAEDATGSYGELELGAALIVEDEPTMEPQRGSTAPQSEPTPGVMLHVFLGGLLSGVAVFAFLSWLAQG